MNDAYLPLPSSHLRMVICTLSVLLVPASVRAQQAPSPPTAEALAEARAHFERGVNLTDHEGWADALAEFRQSRAIVERPNTVFNIGSVLVRLGRHVEAVQAFSDFLRIAEPSDAARRSAAQAGLTTSRNAIAHLLLRGIPTDVDVEVLVDGALVQGSGPDRDIAADPGQHVVEVRARGYAPQRFTLSPRDGARVEQPVSLALTTGLLRVVSATVGAAIEVDGRSVGAGSVDLTVERGSHNVQVSAHGFQDFRQTVAVVAGGTTVVHADLVRPATARRPLVQSPILWIAVGVLAAGAAAAVVGTYGAVQPYYGSTGVSIQGLQVR